MNPFDQWTNRRREGKIASVFKRLMVAMRLRATVAALTAFSFQRSATVARRRMATTRITF